VAARLSPGPASVKGPHQPPHRSGGQQQLHAAQRRQTNRHGDVDTKHHPADCEHDANGGEVHAVGRGDGGRDGTGTHRRDVCVADGNSTAKQPRHNAAGRDWQIRRPVGRQPVAAGGRAGAAAGRAHTIVPSGRRGGGAAPRDGRPPRQGGHAPSLDHHHRRGGLGRRRGGGAAPAGAAAGAVWRTCEGPLFLPYFPSFVVHTGHRGAASVHQPGPRARVLGGRARRGNI